MIKHLLAKSRARKARIGIEVQKNALAVAVCSGVKTVSAEPSPSTAGHAVPQVLHSRILLNESADTKLTAMLSDWVESQDLQNSGCNLVLSSGDYQLLLVEAPDVPESDLREAIRWRIKDLISIPFEKAAIDVFLLPQDGSKAGKKMAYVVVVETDRIHSLVEMVKESGLVLEVIDIAELALRNLAFLCEQGLEQSRGVAMVRLCEGAGTVSLYRNGNMYLSRQFQIAYGGGLLDDIPLDSFILEVQRSLDYYERQMGQVPPSVLYICGENISEDKISADLSRSLTVPVKYFSFSPVVTVASDSEESILHGCIAALGGALRQSVADIHAGLGRG
ncbi:type IV pilus biogenesis protein PilM [Teredinibacter haidensis]|uniref:type IV pilus biogenesis protein PilM n=1 Tax=Teredinibacter haidensis TaxID=2731755 RepID=UPI0009488FE0|nr:hypothetical protein [Teredinibacter haidensis]